MNKRHRREDLVRLLEERTVEGWTFKELSRRSGIPVPTLGYWASKLRREQIEERSEPSLVRVDLIEDHESGAVLIEIASGVRLRVAPGFDQAHLVRLVSALATGC